MAAKKIKGLGTVLRTPKQLDQIGKQDYSGITEAYRNTQYNGKKIIKK